MLDTLRSELGLLPGDGPGPDRPRRALPRRPHRQIVAARLVTALALALIGVAIVYLYRSTKARNPQLNKIALVATITGAVLSVIAGVVAAVALARDVTAFADSARQTEEAARDALADPFTTGAVQLAGLGSAILGLGIALTALNAMRVGLLTRFMGVLGIIVGVLSFLPQLEGQLPFVKIFWLLGARRAVAAPLAGRQPAGLERPARRSRGRPSRRCARRAWRPAARPPADGAEPAKERRPRRGRAEPPEIPAPEPPPAKPHSSSKKKKRKRR